MISPQKEPNAKPKKPINFSSMFHFMERARGGAAKNEDDQRRKAQELVYEAWEAPTEGRAIELMIAALELDPNNVDALLMMADLGDYGGDEQIELIRDIVAQGADNLGPKVFKKDRGYFWGLLETRPYMRARACLIDLLMAAGRHIEAIAELEEMLELNPHDNQGMRYILMGAYLTAERLDGARRLFEKYDERKYTAVFAWSYVLERFLSGNLAEAVEALTIARKQNSHVEAYLKGDRKPPRSRPDSYSLGSREEAIICIDEIGVAWDRHPDAVTWLRQQPRPQQLAE